MRFRKGIATAAVLAALTTMGTSAHANLVTNGGFEAGNFSGWSLSGRVDGNTSVTTGLGGFTANTGTFFAALGAVGSDNVMSQTLATTAGQTYDVNFFLASDGGITNDFTLKFEGVVLFSGTNIASTNRLYVNHDFQVTATQTGSVLEIDSRNDPGFLALDDVSVNQISVPEPTSLAVLATGLIGFGWMRRRRRVS